MARVGAHFGPFALALLVLSAAGSAGAATGQHHPHQHQQHHQRRFSGMRHSGAWEAVLAARAHAQLGGSAGEQGGAPGQQQQHQHHAPFGHEPHLWKAAMSNTMKQVEQVSWWLSWDDLLPPGGSPRPGDTLQHNPDLSGRELDMMHLVRCVNDVHDPKVELDWQGAMQDQATSVKVVGTWWRNHAPRDAVTATTSASVSRLPQLYAQCISWPGPLSVALWVGLLQSEGGTGGPPGRLSAHNQAQLRTAVLQVSQFMLDMQQVPHACKPDVVLVYEVYKDDRARQLLYPFNLVRNLARLQARTPLVALVDVDLVLSRTLYTRASHMYRSQWLKEQAVDNKTVFIIPAFDVRGKHEKAAWADALVSSSKEMLVFAIDKGLVCPFAVDAYPIGHHLTNFDAWKVATGDYLVQHEFKCEPWFVGDRVGMPWHDARYRGYGLDKVQFVMDVAAHGFAFKVMYDSFTIHRAHEKGAAREVFVNGKMDVGDKSLYEHNQNLFTQQELLKNKGQVWTPQVTAATRNCMRVLPWLGGATAAANSSPTSTRTTPTALLGSGSPGRP